MLLKFEDMSRDAGTQSTPARHKGKPWSLIELKQVMTRWQKDLENGGWNSIYLSNHDQPRAVSRFGDDEQYRVQSAKLLATFTHMLRGTPYIYQGEEIGMTNVAFESIDAYRDVAALNMYRELVQEKGMDPRDVLSIIHAKSRDNARTPMQWHDGEHAGFSSRTPWIQVNPNYETINVSRALADSDSIFYTYQKLIRLRREHPVIVYGTYDLILDEHEEIYAFTRTLQEDRLLVILNFSENRPLFELPPHISFSDKELLIGNYEVDPAQDIRRLTLRPFEARVYRLNAR
jgi:oligo-1,6-glucosidase